MVRNDDDFDPFSDEEVQPAPAKSNSKLLRASLFIVGGSFIAILLTAIAANNAAPNSSLEVTSLGLNQAARVVLLLGFVGVLVSYRMTQIKQLFEVVSGPLADNMAKAGDVYHQAKIRTRSSQVLLRLTLSSLSALAAYWILVFNLHELIGDVAINIVEFVQVIFIALMITIGLHSKGPMRGFAIGSVSVLLTCRLESISAYNMFFGGFGGAVPRDLGRSLMISSLTNLTVACVSGIACAFVVARMDRGNAEPNQTPPEHENTENK